MGAAERDALWNHPDVMPSPAELANPEDFLTVRRMAQDMDAQMDADLASLLDGTLGYTEGARNADSADDAQEGAGAAGPQAASEPGEAGGSSASGASQDGTAEGPGNLEGPGSLEGPEGSQEPGGPEA